MMADLGLKWTLWEHWNPRPRTNLQAIGAATRRWQAAAIRSSLTVSAMLKPHRKSPGHLIIALDKAPTRSQSSLTPRGRAPTGTGPQRSHAQTGSRDRVDKLGSAARMELTLRLDVTDLPKHCIAAWTRRGTIIPACLLLNHGPKASDLHTSMRLGIRPHSIASTGIQHNQGKVIAHTLIKVKERRDSLKRRTAKRSKTRCA